jgi:hypothetical protein
MAGTKRKQKTDPDDERLSPEEDCGLGFGIAQANAGLTLRTLRERFRFTLHLPRPEQAQKACLDPDSLCPS